MRPRPQGAAKCPLILKKIGHKVCRGTFWEAWTVLPCEHQPQMLTNSSTDSEQRKRNRKRESSQSLPSRVKVGDELQPSPCCLPGETCLINAALNEKPPQRVASESTCSHVQCGAAMWHHIGEMSWKDPHNLLARLSSVGGCGRTAKVSFFFLNYYHSQLEVERRTGLL